MNVKIGIKVYTNITDTYKRKKCSKSTKNIGLNSNILDIRVYNNSKYCKNWKQAITWHEIDKLKIARWK